MEAQIQIILLSVFLLSGFVAFIIYQNKQHKKNMLKKIRSQYGQRPEREYEYDEFNAITSYYKRKEKPNHYIDDITWNDLDMDHIFVLLNNTYSCIGESYLYYLLRSPSDDINELRERDQLVQYFSENQEEREQMSYFFAKIGKTGNKSIFDYIYNLAEHTPGSNWIHFLCLGLLGLSIVSIFLTSFGAPIFLIALFFNWGVYYNKKKKVEPYIFSCSCFLEMLKAVDGLKSLSTPETEKYINPLIEAKKTFHKFKRSSYFLVSESQSQSLEGLILSYVKLTLHIDLIQFPTVIKELRGHMKEFEQMVSNMGGLESAIAIASFRTMIPAWCRPKLEQNKDAKLTLKNVYHPLIEEPVKNSITVERGILLTGSNASGKSTFLKTVAINAILAQTVFTCMADQYESCFFRIYSSMALQDDLQNQESYYIVEIKSLKRIMDHIDEGTPMLCFIDEVLRGTNTVERIAASSQILKSMSQAGVMCFAATHDVELTHMLQHDFDNYHFQEEVVEHDIIFNYQLYQGRATSRNAIKLLSLIGYQNEIIEQAEDCAKHFLETGEWVI